MAYIQNSISPFAPPRMTASAALATTTAPGRLSLATLYLRCLLLLFLASLFLCGCETAVPSVEPSSSPVLPTNTPPPTATDTPLPTQTHTPQLTDTPTPTTTATPDRTATAAANQAATTAALDAMAAAHLEKYGIEQDGGRVVWAHEEPIRMELTTYMENQNHFLEEAGILTDFAIQTDITWDTSGALSLCGITFHAGEDPLKDAQNRFFMMRLQYSPAWTIWHWEYDQFQNFVSPWQVSPDIHDENASTNRVALIVRGKDIDIFINSDKQRRVEETKLTQGRIALSANQESGRTRCTFVDTWIWAFDQ